MNILYLAPIAYGYLKQRPQYIAEELAKTHTVFYIEPTVSLAAALHRKGLDYRRSIQKKSGHLYVLKLDGMFSLPYRWKYADRRDLAAVFEYMQMIRHIKKIDLIWIGYPGWYGAAKYFRGIRIAYDIMDDYVLLAGDEKTRAYIRSSAVRLEKTADMILTSSILFYERLRKKRKKVFLVPNALPDAYGQRTIRFDEDSPAKRTVFGYTGVIAEWFDNSVVQYLADREDSKVILAGPVSIPKIRMKQVIYTGQIPKADIPEFIKKCDVCLYPFLPGPLLDSVNPVKIYEYLAFNKPVIARRSRETEQFTGMVSLYGDMEEFKQILEEGITKPFSDTEAYQSFVRHNSWSCRGRQIRKILEEN